MAQEKTTKRAAKTSAKSKKASPSARKACSKKTCAKKCSVDENAAAATYWSGLVITLCAAGVFVLFAVSINAMMR